MKKHSVQKIRRRYPRACEPWTAEEDERLWAARSQSVRELAQTL